ncbi:anthranilate phosphoribosyltransferase [Ornithinimicrobium cavernae]|uniref:anthranilate phosphoribosyltransferase n=1 Tax=Ornithinimicrobium cavernae TaxID=2666047 RepID=UPI000D68F8FF|nr:anthranilate phosphoribosyltransferase [Ornithinimicrobium cavernae]
MSETTTSWSDLLTRLCTGGDLTTEEAAWAMDRVMLGEASPARLAAFLAALRAKGETADEMQGLADMMLSHALRFEVDGPSLDIVGTGGDRAHTVNISTMSSVVAAGAGVPVVKHGNRAASSSSGSADVLEALGIRLDATPDEVVRIFHEVGITFCFALTFHPSFRHSAVVRKELGIATAFNFLGPLTNPAQPRYAAVGVADARMAPLVAGVFAGRGKDAAVFRGDDGLDELTTSGSSRVWWVHGAQVREFTLSPEMVGLTTHPVSELRGADAEHNAGVARRVFEGEEGAPRVAVLLNAGTALAVAAASVAHQEPTTQEEFEALIAGGVARAAVSIDSGSASSVIDRWVAATSPH